MVSCGEKSVKYIWFSHTYSLTPTILYPNSVSHSHWRQEMQVGMQTIHIPLEPVPDCFPSVLPWGLKRVGVQRKNDRFAIRRDIVCTSLSQFSVFYFEQDLAMSKCCILCGLSRGWDALGILLRYHLTWGRDSHYQSVWWLAHFPWPVIKQIQLNRFL